MFGWCAGAAALPRPPNPRCTIVRISTGLGPIILIGLRTVISQPTWDAQEARAKDALTSLTEKSFSIAVWIRMPISLERESIILLNPVNENDFSSVKLSVVDYTGHVVAKVSKENGAKTTLESTTSVLDGRWHEVILTVKRGGKSSSLLGY